MVGSKLSKSDFFQKKEKGHPVGAAFLPVQEEKNEKNVCSYKYVGSSTTWRVQ
jgi:hypothetical protein